MRYGCGGSGVPLMRDVVHGVRVGMPCACRFAAGAACLCSSSPDAASRGPDKNSITITAQANRRKLEKSLFMFLVALRRVASRETPIALTSAKFTAMPRVPLILGHRHVVSNGLHAHASAS